MYKASLLFFFGIIFTFGFQALGQISLGGIPLNINNLKSSGRQLVEMPKVDNSQLLKASVASYKEQELKPFRFAHTFHVDLNPGNSGEYLEDINGFDVWQVAIKSEDALSLNVIFDPYIVPPGARLFLFNKSKTEVLGAYTEINNKSFKRLAVSPLAGDEIIVQYEEPVNAVFKGEIGITKVNHDFLGVVASGHQRRPLGSSGNCNIDVNCELADDWDVIKNSVCRIFVDGSELCSGTLLNNTALDKTPYVLTANHCFKDYVNGEENSIFLFNYQSPYCGNLDGDNSNSISGSVLKANSDSLDFSLVELTLIPPPEFHPYYAGWDHSGEQPGSVVSIHHPIGDIKKIAIDEDSPVIDSFSNVYKADGFWRTLTWEFGTTEAGSSGGGYFNQDLFLVGSLTGGLASCSNSTNDYFARFDLSWDYFNEQAKQLKHWLDPNGSEVQSLDGLFPYEGTEFCNAFTNLKDGDSHQVVGIQDEGGNPAGYWGGTNSVGITEFVEKFSIEGSETLEGISLGIGKVGHAFGSQSYITIKVYNGPDLPDELIYQVDVPVSQFVGGAMNFVGFDEMIEPADTFFIGFDISNIHVQDSFAVYQSFRENSNDNSFYFKQDAQWFAFNEKNSNNASSSLAFELIACNLDNAINDTPSVNKVVELNVFPNPANSFFRFDISEEINVDDVFVYDILGRLVKADVNRLAPKRYKVVIHGGSAGVYFIRIQAGQFKVSKKVSYLPN